MKTYKVLLNAQNILTEADGELGHYGFYTTRIVFAANQKEATYKAIDLIKSEENYKVLLLNTIDDPPRLFVEEIEEVEQTQGLIKQLSGYTLYPEEHKHDS